MKNANLVKKSMKVLLIIIISLLTAVAISTIANNVLKAIEQNEYKAPGKLVEVNGEKMDVYSQGHGKKTIVLLSGFGTSSPVTDFAPLVNKLSDTYTVVVVENFGYGWSDITKKPRTVDNIVDETRTALNEAGFKPPYILMPHSISGIYSLYYANKYPDEVEAVIGIDITTPSEENEVSGKASPLQELQDFTGFTRIVTELDPSSVTPVAPKGTYTAEQLKIIKLMNSWHGNNISLINEYNSIKENMGKVKDMTFPQKIPVLVFASTGNIDNYKKIGKDRVAMITKLIGNSDNRKYEILQGQHYLQWTCSAQMAEDTEKFLNSYDKS